MIKEIFGKKIGMTQVFSPEGQLLPVTLVKVEPVCVLEKVNRSKPRAKIGCFKVKETKVSKVKKPQKGYFEKIGVPPFKLVREVDAENGAETNLPQGKEKGSKQNEESQQGSKQPEKAEGAKAKGKDEKSLKKPEEEKKESQAKSFSRKEGAKKEEKTEDAEAGKKEEESKKSEEQKEGKKSEEAEKPSRYFGVEMFTEGEKIAVKAKTKGKGFAGAIKRHRMHRQPSAHGSGMHRRVGSVGASATPSKIVKNKKMPGHLGAAYRVTKNLEILKVDKEKKVIFIKGNTPGKRGAILRLTKQS